MQIFYGSSQGLRVTGNHILHQGILGGTNEGFDWFGSALATGDFDADGYDDLAIGIPYKNLHVSRTDDRSDAGAVTVVHGCASGLGATNCGGLIYNTFTGITLFGNPLGAADGDLFGSSLAAGDFNADGFDDLAIGVPNQEPFLSGLRDPGAVWAVYGSIVGLGGSNTESQIWGQNSPGVQGCAENFDRFGFSLAAADVNGDGFDDLAVGVPFESVGRIVQAGAVNVLFGRLSGLDAAGNQLLTHGPGNSRANDYFGYSLAAGDATGNGRSDLVVGVPGKNSTTGAVHAFRGTSSGLSSLQVVNARVEGGAEGGDAFGLALVMGDFDGDGRCALAVGVPLDDVGGHVTAGSVTILAPRFVRYSHQDMPDVGGVAGSSRRFGASLSRGGP